MLTHDYLIDYLRTLDIGLIHLALKPTKIINQNPVASQNNWTVFYEFLRLSLYHLVRILNQKVFLGLSLEVEKHSREIKWLKNVNE